MTRIYERELYTDIYIYIWRERERERENLSSLWSDIERDMGSSGIETDDKGTNQSSAGEKMKNILFVSSVERQGKV